MSEPPVIHALVRKWAELAGEIAELERQDRACRRLPCPVRLPASSQGHQADQAAPGDDFSAGAVEADGARFPPPGRGGSMVNLDIAVEVIRLMRWTETEALLTTITANVKHATKTLPV